MKLIDKMLLSHFENRKLKKLETRRQEYIKASKEIMIGITKELIYHDIEFSYKQFEYEKILSFSISYSNNNNIVLSLYLDIIRIEFNGSNIATYQHLKWYQYLPFFGKVSTKKQFYYTDDAVRALSTMIITGVKI